MSTVEYVIIIALLLGPVTFAATGLAMVYIVDIFVDRK